MTDAEQVKSEPVEAQPEQPVQTQVPAPANNGEPATAAGEDAPVKTETEEDKKERKSSSRRHRRDRSRSKSRGSRRSSRKDKDGKDKSSRSRSRGSRRRRRRSRSGSRDRSHKSSRRSRRDKGDGEESGGRKRFKRAKGKPSLWDQPPAEAAAGQNPMAVGGGMLGVLGMSGGMPPLPSQGLGGLSASISTAGGVTTISTGIPGLTATLGPSQTNIPPGMQAGQYSDVLKQARRLYVGNLPEGTAQDELKEFFNNIMETCQGPQRQPGETIMSVYINQTKYFGFVEFRSPQEASEAMNLDGIQFRGNMLKIKRPSNYNEMEAVRAGIVVAPRQGALDVSALGIISSTVEDSLHKIFCGGLPIELSEDQVKELLQTYGQLRAFHLVKDRVTGHSKGFCFMEYRDTGVTNDAVRGLNGIQIGDRTLTVRKHEPKENRTGGPGFGQDGPGANVGAAAESIALPSRDQMLAFTAQAEQVTCCLALANMVTPAELSNEQDFVEIVEDIQEEAGKYGAVVSIDIPRPGQYEGDFGVGKVYIEFQQEAACQAAKDALQGRTFDGRTVMASFFNEERFRAKQYQAAQ